MAVFKKSGLRLPVWNMNKRDCEERMRILEGKRQDKPSKQGPPGEGQAESEAQAAAPDADASGSTQTMGQDQAGKEDKGRVRKRASSGCQGQYRIKARKDNRIGIKSQKHYPSMSSLCWVLTTYM